MISLCFFLVPIQETSIYVPVFQKSDKFIELTIAYDTFQQTKNILVYEKEAYVEVILKSFYAFASFIHNSQTTHSNKTYII